MHLATEPEITSMLLDASADPNVVDLAGNSPVISTSVKYISLTGMLGGNSQNFLQKFVRFFLTFKCFYGLVIHRKWVIYDLYSS